MRFYQWKKTTYIKDLSFCIIFDSGKTFIITSNNTRELDVDYDNRFEFRNKHILNNFRFNNNKGETYVYESKN